MTNELTTIASEISRTFTPLGSTDPVTMTIEKVRELWATPTKSGKLPSDKQLVNFIELCAARGLDPRVNDAYLIGYDSSGGPSFSLITAHQALLKRCEASPKFMGRTSGVVVVTKAKDAVPIEREGTIVFPGETLLGGWARIKLEGVGDSYHSVGVEAYNQGFGRWKIDPAGMIVKCAEGGAIRKALPSQLAGCYMEEEMRTIDVRHAPSAANTATAAEALKRLPDVPKPEPEEPEPAEVRESADTVPESSAPPSGDDQPSPALELLIDELAQCVNRGQVNKLSAARKSVFEELSKEEQEIVRENFATAREFFDEVPA
jgi:phage recombination protein Bet